MRHAWMIAILAGLASLYGPAAAAAQTDPALYEAVNERIARLGGSSADSPAPPLIGKSAAIPVKSDSLRIRREKDLDDPLDEGRVFFIPPGSRPFLPDYMTTAAPGSLWPKDSAMTRAAAQKLADYFKRFYPDVVYHVDWDDETVNAYAWKEGSTRHVALMGGLMRHRAIQSEGLGLVLAHELGHHYGGEPSYPSGLSCEGQADYWGASVGMRSAWGDQYRDQMLAAIDQMDAFLSKGIVKTVSPEVELELAAAAGACGHPPAACRKQTYLAAMNGQPKPECAGPSSARFGISLSMLSAGANPG